MDRRERYGDPEEAMRLAFEGMQAGLWTAMPGIVQSFNAAQQTCVIQPALLANLLQPDGTTKSIRLPLLLDCPVFFPGGGGVTLTFPLKQGDECLTVFASRCIDAWWQSGGIQVQAELRMHDLSDGFCFAGFRSVPNVFENISTTTAQLRSADGLEVVELDPVNGIVNIKAPEVNILGVLTINGVPFLAHAHTGVQAGASNTGGVV